MSSAHTRAYCRTRPWRTTKMQRWSLQRSGTLKSQRHSGVRKLPWSSLFVFHLLPPSLTSRFQRCCSCPLVAPFFRLRAVLGQLLVFSYPGPVSLLRLAYLLICSGRPFPSSPPLSLIFFLSFVLLSFWLCLRPHQRRGRGHPSPPNTGSFPSFLPPSLLPCLASLPGLPQKDGIPFSILFNRRLACGLMRTLNSGPVL